MSDGRPGWWASQRLNIPYEDVKRAADNNSMTVEATLAIKTRPLTCWHGSLNSTEGSRGTAELSE